MSLSASVKGNSISCSADGVEIVRGTTDNTFANGGVGLQVWDSALNVSTVRVNFTEISAL